MPHIFIKIIVRSNKHPMITNHNSNGNVVDDFSWPGVVHSFVPPIVVFNVFGTR